jgi:hypothetical protein
VNIQPEDPDAINRATPSTNVIEADAVPFASSGTTLIIML